MRNRHLKIMQAQFDCLFVLIIWWRWYLYKRLYFVVILQYQWLWEIFRFKLIELHPLNRSKSLMKRSFKFLIKSPLVIWYFIFFIIWFTQRMHCYVIFKSQVYFTWEDFTTKTRIVLLYIHICIRIPTFLQKSSFSMGHPLGD